VPAQGKPFNVRSKGHQDDLKRTVLIIDGCCGLLSLPPQLLVHFEITATGNGQLHEDHFANPLWIILQESIESMELVWHAFDDVQTVDADNGLHAMEPLSHASDHFLDCFLAKMPLEVRGFHTNRVCPDGYLSSVA
jgi:hypothetical protein